MTKQCRAQYGATTYRNSIDHFKDTEPQARPYAHHCRFPTLLEHGYELLRRRNASGDCEANATPFIAFKRNVTGGIGGLFGQMFHDFQFKRGIFLSHYHQRSNIESTVMMVKSTFGNAVRSKTEVAAKNEVLAKILCHNAFEIYSQGTIRSRCRNS